MSFEDLIVSEARKLRSLHKAVQETVLFRDRSPSANQAWRRACEDFHYYESPIHPYLQRVFGDRDLTDPETIEFVIAFLEVDARFFRSGYIKEAMLQKLGRAELNPKQLVRLREVLIDAVDRRGGREFRRYCRLAAHIGDDRLLSELRSLETDGDSAGSRARMMLRYVERAKATQ